MKARLVFQTVSQSSAYIAVIRTQDNERKISVSHPTTSATFAVPTDCSKESVHNLNAAEHCLDPTHH